MLRSPLPMLVGAALLAGASLARAQEDAPAAPDPRAATCVPPPCELPYFYPPCEAPEKQHALGQVWITEMRVDDGSEVRPLGGPISGPPEIAVCARRGAESFHVYLPALDEPALRLGMLQALQTAMHARAPVEIAYGLPNGALRKIEGLSFGAPVATPNIRCGYGDFDRCDTAYERKPDAETSRVAGRIVRVNYIGYGKGSRAVQIFTDGKDNPSFLLDPGASPERFLQMSSFAFTAQITGMPVEIVSVPGLPPAEATDRSPVPPLALDITPIAMR